MRVVVVFSLSRFEKASFAKKFKASRDEASPIFRALMCFSTLSFTKPPTDLVRSLTPNMVRFSFLDKKPPKNKQGISLKSLFSKAETDKKKNKTRLWDGLFPRSDRGDLYNRLCFKQGARSAIAHFLGGHGKWIHREATGFCLCLLV